jgi:hypothetical protein
MCEETMDLRMYRSVIQRRAGDLPNALTEDYLFVPEEKIKGIESVLTIVGGKVVYGGISFNSALRHAGFEILSWSHFGIIDQDFYGVKKV